jgi:protein translocase SecG subunit
MYSILIILSIIGAILVIFAVLLQPGKGDLTATFGGLSAQFGAVFGMQRANDLLAKITKVIAAIILILILLTNKFFIGGIPETNQPVPVTQGAHVPTQQQTPFAPPPTPLPDQGQ